jgi:hypothetical protein
MRLPESSRRAERVGSHAIGQGLATRPEPPSPPSPGAGRGLRGRRCLRPRSRHGRWKGTHAPAARRQTGEAPGGMAIRRAVPEAAKTPAGPVAAGTPGSPTTATATHRLLDNLMALL